MLMISLREYKQIPAMYNGFTLSRGTPPLFVDEVSILSSVISLQETELIIDIFTSDTNKKLLLNKDCDSGPIKEMISILLNDEDTYQFHHYNVEQTHMIKAGEIT